MRAALPLALAAFAALPLAAHELYVAEGTPSAALHRALEPLHEQGAAEWARIDIPAEARNMEDARRIAKAMGAGVTTLPCVALRDEQGVYAVLPLTGLTEEALEEAGQQAAAPDREQVERRHHFAARLYLLCATVAQPELDDAALTTAIEESRTLLASGLADAEARQFLGLRCLYPLLMMEYVRGYLGAHTPATEAKLLEAIAALEAARDLDSESALGKQAHAERERLRTARRKSRQYE